MPLVDLVEAIEDVAVDVLGKHHHYYHYYHYCHHYLGNVLRQLELLLLVEEPGAKGIFVRLDKNDAF